MREITSRTSRDVVDFDPEAVSNNNLNSAQGGSPECKWITRSCWALFERKKANDCVKLVRERHGDGNWRGRHFISLPDGLVMVADGVGDGLGLALRLGE